MDRVRHASQPLDGCALEILARVVEMTRRTHGPVDMTLDDVVGHSPSLAQWSALDVLADAAMIIVDSGGIRPLPAGYAALRGSAEGRTLRLAS